MQDEVASRVAGAIEARLRQSEMERARRKPTESLDAWDLYLRALALRYQYTEASIREAIVMLRRALAIDPTLAPAAAMIGSCRMHQRAHRLAPVGTLKSPRQSASRGERSTRARMTPTRSGWRAGRFRI